MEKEKLTAAVAAMYWGANVRVNPKVLQTDNYGEMMHLYNHRLSYTTPDGKRVDHVPTEDCQLEVRKLDRVDALTEEQAKELLVMVLKAEMLEVYAGGKLEGVLTHYEDDADGATAYVVKAEINGKDVAVFINTKGDFSIAIYYDGEMVICGYQVAIINKLRSWGVDCDGLIERGIGYSPVKTEVNGEHS